jgi:class 3 adenylate cyclase/Tfp pilus assembly protein PilF
MISFFGIGLKAQTNIDSLYSVWQDQTQTDNNRTEAYRIFIWNGFLFTNPDTAFILAQSMLSFGEEQPYERAKAQAYNLMAIAKAVKSDYSEALDYFQRGLKISEKIGATSMSTSFINNIGIIYKEQGDYSRALGYYQRSLIISEEMGDKKSSANANSNIGVIYQDQGDNAKALDYYQSSLMIFEEVGDKMASASIIHNIGNIYFDQEDYSKALDYYQRSLKMRKEIEDKHGIAMNLGNMGGVYKAQGDYPQALDYFGRSLVICEQIGDQKGIATALNNIGNIYQTQGDYPKALKHCNDAYTLAQEIGALSTQRLGCKCLYDTYKAMGKGNDALVYLEKLQVIDDSLNAEETSKKLQQMEFAKAMLADSLEQVAKDLEVQHTHKEEVRKKNRTRNIAIGSGFFLLLLAGGLYSRNRYIKKAKDVIEEEKDRSDNLLLNILPEEIANELKAKGKADARDFDHVSILFTDFKEFTQLSEKLSAKDLVAEINHCFEAFDGICGKYGVEKIKTIGDSYMAAGGLPVPNEDSTKNTTLAALEMADFIIKRKAEREAQGQIGFEMRSGIHTGNVVAGIVGVKKFQYDIWGDTVNTASRMESNGEVGKVNISQATYELLKDLPAAQEGDSDFVFESRGKIEAKGKGEIEMYFVSKT